MERWKRVASLLVAAVALALGASNVGLPGLGIEVSRSGGEDPKFTLRLSSGLFSLPANAASVDWVLVNTGDKTETARVTVFRHGGGMPPTEVLPGPLIEHVPPGQDTHNANPVGVGEPFDPGFQYEVVVEMNSRSLQPTAAVWSDHGGTIIPGTVIPPDRFMPQ